MTCGGCSKTSLSARDYAAMCMVCPRGFRLGDPPDAGPNVCENNKSVHLHVVMGQCPADHFARGRDTIHWLGMIQWYGVPAPIRWWLRFRHKARPKVASWVGCGCVKPWKDLWLRVKEFIHANRRTIDNGGGAGGGAAGPQKATA